MNKVRFAYCQEGEMWLGYIKDYPDPWTQRKGHEELNPKNIHEDITDGQVPIA